MREIDPRLAAALAAQLVEWRRTLDEGARRVGWKLGVGDRERIGAGPVLGHLTTATQLEPGTAHRAAASIALHADAEVALHLGRAVDSDGDRDAAHDAIAGFAAALELVDLGDPGDAEAIVATNIFHRAFALGPLRPDLPTRTQGRLIVDGQVRAAAEAGNDFADLVGTAARLLGALGERLEAGDWIITGSVVQVPVAPGEHVSADFGALGRVELALSP